ncbi:pyridoxamine 5'-phosphate oxidase family protein [Natrialbaceae archaeon A-gly3]
MGTVGEDISTNMAGEFLASQGHGILSLAKDNVGYGIPVSYGYDRTRERCVLQLVVGEESQKQLFLERSERVTLTAYAYDTDGEWQSAVASGQLVALSSDAVANWAATIFFTEAANVGARARRSPTTEVEWYELEIETLTGRKSSDGDCTPVFD